MPATICVNYVTDFSSESFGMYVGIIYINMYILGSSTSGTSMGRGLPLLALSASC
ncbi:uncharacterized protein P884DRAFT_57180 [Thermothelomyces heterothallicus CBS 202.75]|uniref:uncharacterized protein n=1 Tax=Thermothelomyces heterothallicus CBS 202.75 TaxID=1149848 RepID=UPI0037426276